MAGRRTICFVHAHPDDEALFTAGTQRVYADEGARTILVTCTDGRLGLDDHVRAGNDPRHHSELTRAVRAGELARSVMLLGVERHVTLGYRDSGLLDWPANHDPRAFVNADEDRVARVLATLFDEENVDVVVTYDENGYYGHPDHIQANRVTRTAVELSSSVQRLFYPVTPRTVLEKFIPEARAMGVGLPLWVLDAGEGCDDEDVDVVIDAESVTETKRSAIAAHASQVDNADLVTMDEELFRLLFGREHFALAWSRERRPVSPDDLFGGLSE